ncbi:MAG: hypothetical protein JW837_09875 [Sedimentisphaerales bacterium]|nr:hypothetical protein [Sedimentisphaerales bacterium]
MSQKDRNKAGLHKKISSIFNGVTIPKSDDELKTSGDSESQETDYTGSLQQILESQVSESSRTGQTSQILPQDKPVTETPGGSSNESEFITTQQFYVEPASSTDFLTVQDSDVVPGDESKDESARQSDEKPRRSPAFLTAQDSKVVPAEKSENEPVRQSNKKSASPLKFLTAQDSKVIPVEESDVEPAQQSSEKPEEPKEFITAKGAKVIPILESDIDPVEESGARPIQRSRAEPAPQPGPDVTSKDKIKGTKKSKVIPVKKSKAGTVKVVKTRTKVKIGELNFLNQIKTKLFTPKPGVSPTKQKVMVIMVPVLFVFLLIFVVKGGVFGTGVNNTAGKDNNTTDAASTVSNTKIEWKIPDLYPATLRDPMSLGSVEKDSDTDQDGYGRFAKLKVKAILISEDGSSSAVIGNRIVHEGEQVKGVNIIKINKDNVEFEVNGEKWTQQVQG